MIIFKMNLSKINILIFICFIVFESFAQEKDFGSEEYVNQTGSPKNIVPDIIKEEVEVYNGPAKDLDAIDAVSVSELPKIDAGWVGILSEEERSLGWNMWSGTDRNFAKVLIELLPVNAPSAAMRSLAKRLLLSRASQPEEASSKELSVIGPDGKPIKNQEVDATFLALRFSDYFYLLLKRSNPGLFFN